MVHQVAGDKIELTTLVGAGSDAHVYEPTPSDARKLADADIVIENGLGFEGWLNRLIESSGYKGQVIIATQGVIQLHLNDSAIDPHAWQDIANGKIYIANIVGALCKADPANAKYYTASASRYTHELDILDKWVRQEISKVPKEKRIAITSHDALRYFAGAYGVTFIAPLGITTSGDASAQNIARLIDQIRAEKVHAVFIENMADPRLIEQLVTDGGAIMGGTLYSDALSDVSGPASTYIAMFRHNVMVITQALLKN
jgi:zinc/manganese transport system substrate-binding protein